MPLQILVAENDQITRETTADALGEANFETISVKNPDEAKLVFQNNPLLAALVIDRRLKSDKEAADQSGWEVALQARENGPARAPIIMYSTYEPVTPGTMPSGQSAKGHLPRISELSKAAGLEALKGKILEEIHLNLRETTDLRDIPRYHQPPIITFAPNNGVGPLVNELRNAGETAEISSSFDELKTAASVHPSALFVVDVASELGIEAIKLLHQSRDISNQNFYIVARISADEFRNEATHVGVNAFVTKQSPQMDALEVLMRMWEYKLEIERTTAAKPQTQLALLQYNELVNKLRDAKQSEHDITAALDIVRQALNWPVLEAKEKLVLTALFLRMSAAGEAALDAEALELCLEGASMLAKDRAATGNVQEWIERAREHSSYFSLEWADEDSLLGDDDDDDV